MTRNKEERSDPKCLLCSERREGQRFSFWGGHEVSRTETAGRYTTGGSTIVEYRDMKRVGAFVCDTCTRRLVFWDSIGWMVIAPLLTIAFLILLLAANGNTFVQVVLTGCVILFGLLSIVTPLFALFPHFSFWTRDLDGVILKRVTPILKRQGKGSTFLTETTYENQIIRERGHRDRAETAEDLLEGIEDDEDDLPRVSTGENPLDIVRCPACAKTTSCKSRTCRHCGATLP
jgi:hypothetical protein